MIAIVERTVFHNPDTGYTVLSVSDGKESFTTTCALPFSPEKGQQIDLEGQWVNDPKYGRQLKATFIRLKDPTTKDDIRTYLSSGIISGVGPATAERMVAKFGEKALEILDRNPQELLQVKGIGKKTLTRIAASWREKREGATKVAELCSMGLSVNYGITAYKQYGRDVVQIIKENPYRLADEVSGIGFAKADGIAANLNFAGDHPFRVRAGLLYTLKEAQTEGHCYLPQAELLEKAGSILSVPMEALRMSLENMLARKELLSFAENIYLAAVYRTEQVVERKLIGLARQPARAVPVEPKKTIDTKELTGDQYYAALMAVRSSLSVITGAAGSGKTTTLRAIINCLEENELSYRLCSPTGKAAKRMFEVTGREAKTIHRLLEYNPSGEFQRNEENPLDCAYLIVDEASMIDLFLMASLLKALHKDGSLVLIGDANQLPPVGIGNVFKDIIRSGICQVSRLLKIQRQREDSEIIRIANDINNGVIPQISNGKEAFLFEVDDAERMANIIVDLATRRASEKLGIPFEEIQVLSPMKKGTIGTASLNRAIQAAVQPPTGVSLKGFMVNDKVMQVRNNYKKGAFNGDIGYVKNVDAEGQTLIVAFDAADIEYESSALDELTLAYATTVHKFQGSETTCVIFPVHTAHWVMLRRDLLYTAVTRTKQTLIIVGTRKAIAVGVRNDREQKRYTGLFRDTRQ